MKSDKIGGLIGIIIGLFSISEAFRMYPYRVNNAVGDHVMPAVVGGLLILLGVIMIIFKTEKFEVKFPERSMIIKISSTLGVLLLYWVMLHFLGYTLSTFLAGLLLFRIIGSYSILKTISFAALTIAALYLVFIYWLNMPFPAWIWG
ncbi:MAG TPA: tripartite tricarboxylate transporter TctB family protein [Peptococcaceae bacterium]|nr:tripartite tricarboxylate transporter TctB family protein [Peptococcaceae bacterium]